MLSVVACNKCLSEARSRSDGLLRAGFYLRSKRLSWRWNVSTEMAHTYIVEKPDKLSNKRDAKFVLNVEGENMHFNVKFDEKQVDPGSISVSHPEENVTQGVFAVHDVADGEHSIRVAAVTSGGDVSKLSTEYTWTVDGTAPTVTIDPSRHFVDCDPAKYPKGDAKACVSHIAEAHFDAHAD